MCGATCSDNPRETACAMSILVKGQSTSSPSTAAPDSFVQCLTGGFEIIATCLLGSVVLLPHCSAVGVQEVHCPLASVANVQDEQQ